MSKICSIICGAPDGSLPEKPEGLIICADKGLDHALAAGLTPDMIVGDFDSANSKPPEGIPVVRTIPEKDDTDTILACEAAIEEGCDEIRLYCALGGRTDHTIANIQTLYYGRVNGVDISISDGRNEAKILYPGVYNFERRNGCYLSVLAYSEKVTGVNLKGVKYPLENAEITNFFPIGLSNEIISESAEVSFSDGVVLVIFSKKI